MSDKHSLEFNKIAAGFLMAGIIAFVCGFIADYFYRPHEAKKRGFSVEVVEEVAGDAGPATVEIDVGTLLASADAAKGEAAFQKKCTSCHTAESGGANKVGPNLFGIIGSQFGHKGDFAYSDAVKSHGGSWGYDEMNHWLKAPAKYIKGNKMGFAGVKNDAERADIIMYLKSISSGAPAIPAPIPVEAAPAAEEKAAETPPAKH